jgi:hypothetical protein
MGKLGRMMKLKCNSCGATYPDTSQPGSVAYFHACPDRIVDTPEATDNKGNIITPAKFKPTPNPRNENRKRHPDKPAEHVMISEGSGVTEVE